MTAFTKGGQLSRTRKCQPLATSIGPNTAFQLFNKLQIESKKSY